MADPTSVANLVAWYKAGTGMYKDAGVTPVSADGDSIQQWNDQSGNGVNITQATAANQMKWDQTNGFVCGEYGNKTQFFTFPTVSAITNTNSTVVFIGQLVTLRDTNSTAGNVTAQYIFSTPSFFLCCGSVRGGFSRTSDGTTNRQDTANILATSPACWIFSNSGTGTTIYVNGQTGAIGTMATHTFTSGLVGGLTGNTNPLQARIKDICIYRSAISSSDAATLLTYAQTRGVPTSVTGNVLIDGDSISAGYANTLNRNWPNQMSLSAGTRVSNFAEASITLATLSSEAAVTIDPWIQAGKTNVLIVFAGTNDIVGGATAATTYSALQSYCTARKTAGWNKIIIGTMLPRTALADDTQRLAYNTSIRNGIGTTGDALADCGGDATIGATGAASNATYYADGTHPTNAGSAIIAPYFQSALYSVLPSSNPTAVVRSTSIGIGLSIGLGF